MGTFTDQQLAAGLNIASATADGWEPGGPWDAEAGILIHLTEARSQLEEAARSLDQYLPNHPERTACMPKAVRSTSGSRRSSGPSSSPGRSIL